MHVPRKESLIFYATVPDACPYLGDRDMVSVFADPQQPMSPALYGGLIELGFRRSGNHVYRHQCRGCHACVPLRLPVDRFRPDRNQRRVASRNQDITVRIRPSAFDPAHFQLYERYVNTRHQGGGMDDPTPESYWGFVASHWGQTQLVEFRLGERLVGVAVTDQVPMGLSAVYTYFDPELAARSLGTLAILWQVQAARRMGLPYVYLGFWNAQTPKMAYKIRFQPAEGLVDGIWGPAP